MINPRRSYRISHLVADGVLLRSIASSRYPRESYLIQPWEYYRRLSRASHGIVGRYISPTLHPFGADGKLQWNLVSQGSVHLNTTTIHLTQLTIQHLVPLSLMHTESFNTFASFLNPFLSPSVKELLGPLRALIVTSYALSLHTPPAGICCPPLKHQPTPCKGGNLQ
jgi:hypothetical protein